MSTTTEKWADQPENTRHWHTAKAMEKFGGGFVSRLGQLYYFADEDNQRRIRLEWSEYWLQYMALATTHFNEKGRDWWG